MQLAKRVELIKPSATLAVSAKAAALRAEGRNIISLSTGEPDFDTPEPIKQAAIEAMREGFTKYTPVDGIPPLKKAIVDKFAKDNQLEYQLDNIIVTSGAKQAIFNLALALLNPGDEVIIPSPYWVSYVDIALIAEAKPVIVAGNQAQQFKITPQQLTKAITPKTRLLLLNSPSNPSGMVYSRDELAALAEVLLKHPNIIILSDDIYEPIIWGGKSFSNICMVEPKLLDRTVVVNGVSKTYSMTGWRIGYAAGPTKLIATMKKLQSQSTSNPNSIAQKAALAALTGDQQCVTDMVARFEKRHQYVYDKLSAMKQVECLPVDGTFYSFPNVQAAIDSAKNIADDIQLAEYLLEAVNLAVVPGSAFGMPGHIRLSFAASDKALEQGMTNLEQGLTQL